MFRLVAVAAVSSLVVFATLHPASAAEFEGWYAGASLGFSHSKAKTSQRLNQPGCAGGGGGGVGCAVQQATTDSVAPNLTNTNVTGGVQAGYNWRFGNFVAGLEGDLNYVGFDKTVVTVATWTTGGTKTLTSVQTIKSNVVATFRPRIGYIPAKQWLVYLTGGLALSDQSFSNNTSIYSLGGGPPVGTQAAFSTSSSNTTGSVIGGGFEYAWSDKVTIKAEYQHLEFKNPAKVGPNTAVTNLSLTGSSLLTQSKVTADIVRVGANWRL